MAPAGLGSPDPIQLLGCRIEQSKKLIGVDRLRKLHNVAADMWRISRTNNQISLTQIKPIFDRMMSMWH